MKRDATTPQEDKPGSLLTRDSLPRCLSSSNATSDRGEQLEAPSFGTAIPSLDLANSILTLLIPDVTPSTAAINNSNGVPGTLEVGERGVGGGRKVEILSVNFLFFQIKRNIGRNKVGSKEGLQPTASFQTLLAF